MPADHVGRESWADLCPAAEAGNDDASTCATLEITGTRVAVTSCDGQSQTVELGVRDAQEWAEIQARLAPFQYSAGGETVKFAGTGTVEDGVWQLALLNWARARYDELSTGRSGTAVHTVVAWNLGPTAGDADICERLIVLSWGYAYADKVACNDGTVIDHIGGWLETPELQALDGWLNALAPLYIDNNYIAGLGTQPINDAEIGEVEAWANTLWTRFWSSDIGSRPMACADLSPGMQLLFNEEHGYCLVYPSSYSVEQSMADEVNLVLGSLMNHVDPRVSITVEDAAGRTLTQVASQLEADYALPGIPVEQTKMAVDGENAIVLDNLPGQDLNRRVVFLHSGRLYSLFFTPLGDTEEAQAAMEVFYAGIMDTFRFLKANR